MSNDTPISKYLASIGDRRHSLYGGAQQTPLEQVVRPTLARTFDFDETYYRDDASLLFAPSPNKTKNDSSSSSSPFSTERKRKRVSLFGDNSENYEKKIDDLERLLRQTQAELIDSRAVVTKLQHQKIDNEAKYKEKVINYDKAEKDMKRELYSATEKLQELEKKIIKMENKEKETSEDFNKQKVVLNCTISALNERVSKLQTTNSELEQKLFQESLKSGDTVRKLNTELEVNERGAEKWIIESQTLKEQLEMVQSQLIKCQLELKDAQTRATNYEELKSKYEETMSDESNTKTLQEKLKKYENLYVQEQLLTRKLLVNVAKLKQENETLKSTVSSEMVLREEISSLEKQNAFITEELKAKVASDTDRTVLRHELNEWKGIVSKLGSNCTTPLQFESFLRQNQNLLLEYKHENSSLKLELKNKENILLKLQSDTKRDNDILREQVKILKEEKQKLALDLSKTTKRLNLIAKDRDSIKGLKDSYELEFAGQKESMTNVRELQNRNLNLEEIVGDYEALISDDPSFAKKPCEKCEELTTRLTSLTSDLEQTKRDLEEKSTTLAVSETTFHQRIPDDLSTTTTGDVSFKVLSYGKNPSLLSTEERLKELLSENEQLRAKINKLESDSTFQNSNTSVLEEKRSLEEQLKNLERKHEILTDAYDYETTQLQTAIGKLFGFHIVLVREPQSQIRLQSVNSPDQDLFIFQQSDNGDWMLLETPVLDIFRQEIEDYLVQAGQIPSFLAIVTIRYAQGMPSENLDDTVIHQQNPGTNQQLEQIQHQEEEEEEGSQEEYEENEEQQQEYEENESGSGSGDDEEDEEVAEEQEYEEEDEEENDEDNDDEDDRDGGSRNRQQQQQQQQHYNYDESSDDDIVMLD